MSGNAVRMQAIKDVEAYIPPTVSFSPAEAPGEVFGENVFSKSVMQKRLPKSVYRSVIGTVEHGLPLDPVVADAVASAMKDWARSSTTARCTPAARSVSSTTR
jgi:glutamine synthetase